MAEMLEQLLEIRLDISLPLAAMTLLGLLFIFLAVSRIRRHKILAAGIHGFLGMLLLVLGMLLLAIALNIHTYQRLTYEQEIAVVTFQQLAPQSYNAILEFKDKNTTDEFLLNGDEWQLDARILRWKPAAQLLGLNAQYRLERLSGRYQDLDLERASPRTVYLLGDQAGLDIWSLARRYQNWLLWIDAYYGSATYLPMQDKTRFSISINQYGIMARPVNAPAQQTIYGWE